MSDISELETRITTALERISTGLSVLAPESAGGSDDDIARLKAELEDERTTNSQLVERVKAVQQSRSEETDGLRSEIERLMAQLAADADVISKLRQANIELRANNDALRTAAGSGGADGELINQSVVTELEGLRVTQAADRAELDAVLSELGQVIAEADAAASNGSGSTTNKEGSDA